MQSLQFPASSQLPLCNCKVECEMLSVAPHKHCDVCLHSWKDATGAKPFSNSPAGSESQAIRMNRG